MRYEAKITVFVLVQMAELRRDIEDEDVMFDFHIFGTRYGWTSFHYAHHFMHITSYRDSLTVQFLIPRELLAKLPDEGLRQGEPIRVVPVLFTQGVNEKQTFANIKNE